MYTHAAVAAADATVMMAIAADATTEAAETATAVAAAEETAMADGRVYLEKIAAFSRMLMQEGLTVSPQETADACRMLIEDFGGELPDTMEELLKFPGVGRKVANLLLGDLYQKGGVVADTHCMRICGRFGMYREGLKDAGKIEMMMRELMDPMLGSDFCHRIVIFGREICSARSPGCTECPLADLCEKRRAECEKNAHGVAL